MRTPSFLGLLLLSIAIANGVLYSAAVPIPASHVSASSARRSGSQVSYRNPGSDNGSIAPSRAGSYDAPSTRSSRYNDNSEIPDDSSRISSSRVSKSQSERSRSSRRKDGDNSSQYSKASRPESRQSGYSDSSLPLSKVNVEAFSQLSRSEKAPSIASSRTVRPADTRTEVSYYKEDGASRSGASGFSRGGGSTVSSSHGGPPASSQGRSNVGSSRGGHSASSQGPDDDNSTVKVSHRAPSRGQSGSEVSDRSGTRAGPRGREDKSTVSGSSSTHQGRSGRPTRQSTFKHLATIPEISEMVVKQSTAPKTCPEGQELVTTTTTTIAVCRVVQTTSRKP